MTTLEYVLLGLGVVLLVGGRRPPSCSYAAVTRACRRPARHPPPSRRGAERRGTGRGRGARRSRRPSRPPAGWSGCGPGWPARSRSLGRGLLVAAVARHPRRGHLGGRRGDPARRRRRGRPDRRRSSQRLRTRLRVEGAGDARRRARACCARSWSRWSTPTMDRGLHVDGAGDAPGVVLVVGVNGTGKTTTVGKLARVLVAEGTDRAARRRRHVPRRRGRPAADLGRAGRRRHRARRRGRRPRQRRASRPYAAAPSAGSTPCWSTPPAGCRTRPA